MRPAAVVVRRLRRSWHGQRLLDGVDLEVPVGARLLLVSRPEASGSLLLRVLAGLVRPASGSVRLAGLAHGNESAAGWARRVAFLAAEPGIYPWLTPAEALDLAARLAGYDRRERRPRIEAAIEVFRLQADVDRPISRGGAAVAQKTALAAALLTDPEVVLLDEPLRSVLPDERARLLRLPGQRRTVLLASRLPASEAGIVTQVALLRDGRLAVHASAADLEQNGLALSFQGIEALADLQLAGLPAASSG
ncbi:MAG TPA: ATP-binding cassette domain-containing protein [Candidatus Dormibacteraeota bacterium]|nr:ATP-binding cassette domain-containing protein [Candidatus Dormibacteraeota bacterium]